MPGTVRQERATSLAADADLFRILSDATADAIFAIDEDSTIVLANRAAEQIFGYARDELVGRPITMLMPEPLRERHTTALQKYLASGVRQVSWKAASFPGTHKNGREIALEISFGEFTRAGERFFTGIVRDVTQRNDTLAALRQAQEKLERRVEERTEELRATNENLSALLAAIPLAFVAVDRNGLVRAWNRAAEKVFGWSAQEVIGQPFPIPKHDHAYLLDQLTSDFKGDQPMGVKVRSARKDGSTVDLALWSAPLYAGDGGVDLALGVFMDVTERMRAEAAARESELRLRQLAENIREAFFLTDAANTEMLYVSPAYEEIWGRSRESLYARPGSWAEAIHPDDLETVRGITKQASVSGRIDYEYRIVRPDGSQRWMHVRGFPIQNEAGEIYRIAGVAEDITDRKQAEDIRARMAAIVKYSDDAIFGKELDGTITSWNDSAARLFGYAADDIIGKSVRLLIPPERHAEENAIHARLLRGEHVEHFETVRRRKDGGLIDVSMTISPVRNAAGQVVGAANITRDITEIKVAAKALQQYTDQLQNLSRALLGAQERERQHIARELHDQIGQALTALQINLQGELRTGRHSKSRLEDSVAIVEQTLEQVRGLSLDLRPPMLDDLGLSVTVRWYVTQQAQRAGLQARIEMQFDDTLVSAEDRIVCFRIVQEAVTNIVRHAQAKVISVRLWQEGASLCVQVRDDGIGFDVARARAHEGSLAHLGLLGMEERASLVGGKLEVRSASGVGTELELHLPLRTALGGPG